MASSAKRSYNSGARKAKAQETRKRILDTATRLFEDEGFESVTIEKLAKEALVSMPTIYLLFQSKRGILRELMDEVFPPEQFTALVEQGDKEPSPQKRLTFTAKITRQMYDAERAQMSRFHGASVLSPEFKELEREREERRYVRQEEFVTKLAKEKWLAPDLTLAKARDILWAFTGRDNYRMYVVERGWTSDEYETWLSQYLIKALLRDNPLPMDL